MCYLGGVWASRSSVTNINNHVECLCLRVYFCFFSLDSNGGSLAIQGSMHPSCERGV